MMAKARISVKSNEQTNKRMNNRTYDWTIEWVRWWVNFLRESYKQQFFLNVLSNGFDCADTQKYKTNEMVET